MAVINKHIEDLSEGDYGKNIENFPVEVVRKMLEYQFMQNNMVDVSIFEDFPAASKMLGGFDWINTIEGISFWNKIIKNNEFDLFFTKYPKNKSTLMASSDFLNVENCSNESNPHTITTTPDYFNLLNSEDHAIKINKSEDVINEMQKKIDKLEQRVSLLLLLYLKEFNKDK